MISKKVIIETLKKYILNKAAGYFGYVEKEDRKLKLDEQQQKMAAIIENHIDEKDWLLEQLGMTDKHNYKSTTHHLDYEKIREYLVEKVVILRPMALQEKVSIESLFSLKPATDKLSRPNQSNNDQERHLGPRVTQQ